MIDPQVQSFLEELRQQDPPPFETLTPDEARAAVVADSQALGPPEPVGAVEDRSVPGPAGEIPLRVYVPHGTGPFGAFVYYHGGGWVVGDIETHDSFCRELANAAGCVVVSVDYRLAPEHKYPAAVEDAYAAAEWVAGHSNELGAASGRLAVGGDSAGGNLAAAVCLMARDRKPESFSPDLQVLIYPIVDYDLETPSYRENAEGYLLTRSTMQWFWDCYLAREEDGFQPYASPLRAEDLAGVAPALVLTAEYDPLRDEGEAYAARLREAGVPVTLTRYDGMIHAFLRRTATFDKAKAALEQVAGALRRCFDTAL